MNQIITLLLVCCCVTKSQSQSAGTQTECEAKVDFVFILDASGSIGSSNFDLMIDFVKNVSSKFDIGYDKVRIGAMTFSSSPTIRFHLLDHHDLPSIINAFDNIIYTAGGTYTGHAMEVAYTQMFIESMGDRPEVPNIAIIITDGQSSDRADTVLESQNLRDHGVQVFAVGISGANIDELNTIATDPDSSYVLFVDNFNQLYQFTTSLSNKACSVPLLLYGPSAGDNEYRGADDDCADPIQFQYPVPVFGRTFQSIYPCTNGIASFDKRYTTSYPRKGLDIAAVYDLLMPLFTDIDLRTQGTLYYNYHEKSSTNSVHQQNFETVERYIRQMYVVSFEAEYLVVMTWHQAPRYNGGSSSATATFQLTLLTDWTTTYVIYIYGEGQMHWDPNFGLPNTLIGFQVNQAAHSDKHILSHTTASYDMDAHAQTNGVRGIVAYKLADDNNSGSSPLARCFQWFNAYVNVDVITSPELLQCPCTLQLLLQDDSQFYEDTSTTYGKQIRCFVTWYSRRTKPHAMKCCYNKAGNWISHNKGPGGFIKHHPYVHPFLYSKYDDTPRTDCCSTKSSVDVCKEKYRKLRPVGQCFSQTPSKFAALFGDPHIVTLDGQTYSFNGLGEYKLLTLTTQNPGFELQGRTGRALTQDNRPTDATIFEAFAARDHTGASLHVEIDAARTGLILYGNGIEHTVAFQDASTPFNYTGNGTLDSLVLSRTDTTLIARFTAVDISLGIKVEEGVLLSISVRVGRALRGQTIGLLGNVDGNPDNDFMFPNGTVMGPDSTEKELFPFGQSWMISPGESAFMYFNGLDPSNYSDPAFVPRFLEDQDPDIVANATLFCGGESNQACIYDLVLTGNPDVAASTNTSDSDGQNMVAVSNNNIPVLNSSDPVRANVGENVSVLVMAYDEGPVTFVLTGNASLSSITDNSVIVTWIADASSQLPFSLTAVDPLGMSSAELQLDIVLCDGCDGHGQCNFTTVVSVDIDDGDTAVPMATCVCDSLNGISLWTGTSCDIDFDGCASSPCSLEQECIDLNATEHEQQQMSHLCGPCPDGYQDDGSKCSDIDECAGSHNCEQVCINTEPGYDCACNQGYRPQTGSANLCEDVNECDEALHNCEHKCNNMMGTYNCSCFAGYTLNGPNTCVSDGTADACALVALNCVATAGCTNETGTPECFCLNGYELIPDGMGCINIDECQRNVCPQQCNDTVGSFECSCYAGYQLKNDSINCQECDGAHWGINCENVCICGRGVATCDNVRGCVCQPGYTGSSCNDDIDECAVIPGHCPGPRQLCNNTVGSYFCTCEDGYQMTSDGRCEDIDECSDPGLNECQQECSNTPGSFVCSCRAGYVVDSTDPTQCADFDECDAGISTCEQICDNVPGQFNCRCNFGFVLDVDRTSCSQVEDLCATYGGVNCSHFCIEDQQTVSCGCPLGFDLDSDSQTCMDIDECSLGTLNRCSRQDLCYNIPGGYQCSCPVGQRLQNDNRTCQVCDANHYGDNCALQCVCGAGVDHCDPVTGCVCQAGWDGPKCDIEQDECFEDPNICQGDNVQCINYEGGYSCQCQDGYQNNAAGDCEDIDECASTQLNTCDQICENTNGSFVCKCQPGYSHTNGLCRDINECVVTNDCHHTCANTDGSYRCSCYPGYRLDLANRKQCIVIDECNTTQQDQCAMKHADCVILNLQPTCVCWKGYEGNASDVSGCTDIRECDEDPRPCEHLCLEEEGGFNCSCHAGFQLDADKRSCKACPSNTFGDNCTGTCSCNTTNVLDTSQECNQSSGVCICSPEWTGSDCSDDIDECAADTHGCNASQFLTCLNQEGGYECVCFDGFLEDNAGMCIDTDECAVVSGPCASTGSCNNTVGSYTCDCQPGYEGAYCGTDIDECAAVPGPCVSTGTCNNTVGSYTCDCQPGYKGADCGTDIDECAHTPGPCASTGTCNNAVGSYTCDCHPGYEGADCGTDIDECVAVQDPCASTGTCNNTVGSYICDCHPGYEGDDCGTDTDECSSLTSPCASTGTCNNTVGSYICDCQPGYEGADCGADTDECAAVPGPCASTGTCSNTVGSYTCNCQPGYEGANCGTDTDECSTLTSPCASTGTCNNTVGSYFCDCQPGYEGDDCGADIDECATVPGQCASTGTCNNTVGSYTCDCQPGYEGADCGTDTDECMVVPGPCASTGTCNNTVGSYTCDCQPGYEGADCGTDTNECAALTSPCASSGTCSNTVGSYTCDCQPGYMGADCGTDIDECTAVPGPCASTGTCSNTIGSYTCDCQTGYEGYDCGTDIDECEEGIHSCASKGTCNNEPGSYSCICDSGYNGQDCSADIDECEEGTHSCASTGTCKNEPGSYSCTCDPGYTGQDCITGYCDTAPCRHICSETSDGYECSCRSGYRQHHIHPHMCIALRLGIPLRLDGNFTVDLESPTSSRFQELEISVCNQVGAAMRNSILVTSYIDCYVTSFSPGSIIANTTVSLNESTATTENGEVVLIQPQNVTDAIDSNRDPDDPLQIIDIGTPTLEQGYDECEAGDDNCEHICLDQDVGYTCSCRPGYVNKFHPNQHQCIDLDECGTGLNDCNQTCVNTVGSFTCSCNKGFRSAGNKCLPCLTNTFGDNCSGTCACNTTNVRDTTQECDQRSGACLCKPEWTGAKCSDDKDECTAGTHACDVNTVCSNNEGSYECVCSSGYQEDDNGACVSESSSLQPGIIIGVSVIGAVLLVVAVAAAAYFCCRQESRHMPIEWSNTDDPDYGRKLHRSPRMERPSKYRSRGDESRSPCTTSKDSDGINQLYGRFYGGPRDGEYSGGWKSRSFEDRISIPRVPTNTGFPNLQLQDPKQRRYDDFSHI